jgi:hypothetical protein
MEEVMSRVNKILLDDRAAEQVVPYLPLEPAMRPKALERPLESPAAGAR